MNSWYCTKNNWKSYYKNLHYRQNKYNYHLKHNKNLTKNIILSHHKNNNFQFKYHNINHSLSSNNLHLKNNSILLFFHHLNNHMNTHLVNQVLNTIHYIISKHNSISQMYNNNFLKDNLFYTNLYWMFHKAILNHSSMFDYHK